MADGEVTAAILIIGNEILSGRTQDTNVAYIALGLNEAGVRLKEVRVVPDDEKEIIDAVNALRAKFTYVFTTGGIGPTHDDITAECIAKAFGVKLLRDPRAVERLKRVIAPENLNEARLRMANIPEGGDLIDNPVSAAPGFRIGNVHVMAGIPRVMQGMFDGVKGSLKGGKKVLSQSIDIYTGEGAIAAGLTAIQSERPSVEIGSYPFARQGIFGTVIVARGTEAADVSNAIDAVRALAQGQGARTEETGEGPK
ncbi:MAG TPA: molybdopterin-binding protein [Magnetospirillaceae bacterium]|jgi:molybdenum cofactor synthesis domain-containing protein